MVIDQVETDTLPVVALNADIVGFSKLMADDPVATANAVDGCRGIVGELVTASSGRLINFVGDSFMAVFDTAVDAMEAAMAISAYNEEHNADLPRNRWIQFRMGLDQGAISQRGDDYFGDTLNIAARIQARAQPGGISVSGRVYQALDEPGLRFRSTGKHQLRNIPGPIEIFDFAALPRLDHVIGSSGVKRLNLALPTVVLLPVITEGVSPALKSTAQVFRSDLIHRLSAIPHLSVIESLESEDHAGKSAHYVIESGVIEVGERVRVYVKLVEIATFNIVSSHKWATTSDGMYDMIEEMIEEVARGIEVDLVVGQRSLNFETTEDPEILRRMYQGWYHLMTPSQRDWLKAVDLYEEVVQAAPDYVLGRVMQAFANWLGVAEGLAPDPEIRRELAFDQAVKVTEMGDPTGLGNMIMGAVYLDRGLPDEALAIIEQAQVVRPTCDLTLALEGSIRRYLGQWERSVDLIGKAIDLAAVTPPWYPTVQACSLFMGDRLDAASTLSEEVIEHYPDTLEALLVLAAVQTEMGLTRRARATAENIKERFPSLDFDDWLRNHPYKDRAIVDRWRQDLIAAGLIHGS